jgi:cell division protein ZapA (FtsZ GTPase activity inhibitor)
VSKSDLRIDILGTSFAIAADEDPAYLESLLNQYRIVIENTRKAARIEDPLKIAIIAGFLLCDEIQKTRKAQESGGRTGQGLGAADFSGEADSREAEKLTNELIIRLDEALNKRT